VSRGARKEKEEYEKTCRKARLLGVLASQAPGRYRSFTELYRLVGVSRPTLSRYLRELVEGGYLEKEEGRGYRVTNKLLAALGVPERKLALTYYGILRNHIRANTPVSNGDELKRLIEGIHYLIGVHVFSILQAGIVGGAVNPFKAVEFYSMLVHGEVAIITDTLLSEEQRELIKDSTSALASMGEEDTARVAGAIAASREEEDALLAWLRGHP